MKNTPKISKKNWIAKRLSVQWSTIVISIPYIWLLIFFLTPFFIVIKISLAEYQESIPPFSPLIQWVDDTKFRIELVLENYNYLLEDDLYWRTYLNSLKIAFISTVLCLAIGYPMAYYIAKQPSTKRNLLLLFVIIPFWTSFLLRIYAWIGIISNKGLINSSLMAIGIIDTPLKIIYTDSAIYLGIVYTYLPFMVLPLYASLESLDRRLNEAASDLGATPVEVFFTITLPLSMPGIVAGSMLVFIPAIGEYVIPQLLGGPDTLMIGRILYDEFFINRDWPVAAAVATALLALLVIPIMIYQYFHAKEAKA